jgi:hypothetical protein
MAAFAYAPSRPVVAASALPSRSGE